MRAAPPGALVLAAALAACRAVPCPSELPAAPPPLRSLLGEPLEPPEIAPERRVALEADLTSARAAHAAGPEDEEAAIWHGRRLAYLGRFREAIEVYSRALEEHPESHRLLRHRGHRTITTRQLDRAIADLERAAERIADVPDEVEPDGAPNAYGIPRSTTHTNVTYHLGLARYLTGDFEGAAAAWRRCARDSPNDDMLCAASYWLHLSLRRLDRDEEARAVLAPVHADMEILENGAYHRLLLAFRGDLEPSELARGLEERGSLDLATVGYGLGALASIEGREEEADAWWRRVVDDPFWPAFGHIAAEAELARGSAVASGR